MDKQLPGNADILEAAWIKNNDIEKFDFCTLPVIDHLLHRMGRPV
ncbi:hypothetical protein [Rossellomorea vietnamensis]|nr:hypothetical protein [Rossellomorea vietnamensis]